MPLALQISGVLSFVIAFALLVAMLNTFDTIGEALVPWIKGFFVLGLVLVLSSTLFSGAPAT